MFICGGYLCFTVTPNVHSNIAYNFDNIFRRNGLCRIAVLASTFTWGCLRCPRRRPPPVPREYPSATMATKQMPAEEADAALDDARTEKVSRAMMSPAVKGSTDGGGASPTGDESVWDQWLAAQKHRAETARAGTNRSSRYAFADPQTMKQRVAEYVRTRSNRSLLVSLSIRSPKSCCVARVRGAQAPCEHTVRLAHLFQRPPHHPLLPRKVNRA